MNWKQMIMWRVLDFLYFIGLLKGFGRNFAEDKWEMFWFWQK